jgi:hypothetical protein
MFHSCCLLTRVTATPTWLPFRVPADPNARTLWGLYKLAEYSRGSPQALLFSVVAAPVP